MSVTVAMPAAPHHGAGLDVDDLLSSAYAEAVGVLARGMRDNPIHVAAYGRDPARRERRHARLMRTLFATATHNEPIGVWRDGVLVGVAGAIPHGGGERPGLAATLRTLPAIAACGPRSASRIFSWASAWRERDPDEPHVHLGPVAVDRHLQGHGFGTLLLAEHCRRLDAAGAVGRLETDKAENVPFYERGGYCVVAEADVIGVPCWFMRREPATR